MEKLYNDDVNVSVLTGQIKILQVLRKDGDYFCFDAITSLRSTKWNANLILACDFFGSSV